MFVCECVIIYIVKICGEREKKRERERREKNAHIKTLIVKHQTLNNEYNQ